jgi:large subunit ribosomal protein L36e
MPAIFAIKLAILLQLIRLFVTNHKSTTFVLMQILIWLNLLFFAAMFFVQIFECIPRERIWNPFIQGKCINIKLSFIVSAAINIVSDFSILALPTVTIWRLQMATSRKLSVSAVFAMGIL